MGDFIGQGQAGGVAPHLDGGDGLPGGAHRPRQFFLGELSLLSQLWDTCLDSRSPLFLNCKACFAILV